jgi:predicted O-methyltransferase YrrM
MDDRDIAEILALVETIDGWLTPKEGQLLYDLARRAPGRGAIVEIGSWKGKSTIWLARDLGGAPAGPYTRSILTLAPRSTGPVTAPWTP